MNETLLRNVDCALRSHLAAVARMPVADKATITYGDLAKKAGIKSARAVPVYLNRIAEECERDGEPSIDCLVINKKIGKPGGKWLDDGIWKAEIARCIENAKPRVDEN